MKRFSNVFVLFCVSLVWFSSAAAQTVEETILAAFARVSDAELEHDARVLVGLEPFGEETIVNRAVGCETHDLATEFLVERIEAMGIEAVPEPFPWAGETCANVIAEITGEENPETIWVVGGHYDAVHNTQGAVDNASGAIVVLQTLNALRAYRFRDTIRFILFDAEEGGLVGSARHALRARLRGDDIRLLINLDLPGWRTAPLNAAFANSDWLSWPLMNRMNEIVREYPCGSGIIGVPAPSLDSSNHASFWEYGYRALIVGSLFSLTGFMHTPEDNFDKLDLEQCANVTRMVIATLGEQAGIIPETPDDDTPDDDTTDDDAADDDATDDDNDDDVADDDAVDDDAGDDDDDDDDDGCGC
ncbi:MAG TPA: M28 family peptidase [bacterium]|nr:M28 family peptidase [bacterium]